MYLRLSGSSPNNKEAHGNEKGASAWVTTLPIDDYGFFLHKGDFRENPFNPGVPTHRMKPGATSVPVVFGPRGQDAFFDVRVFHPNASSYRNKDLTSLYKLHENAEKKEYGERIWSCRLVVACRVRQQRSTRSSQQILLQEEAPIQ